MDASKMSSRWSDTYQYLVHVGRSNRRLEIRIYNYAHLSDFSHFPWFSTKLAQGISQMITVSKIMAYEQLMLAGNKLPYYWYIVKKNKVIFSASFFHYGKLIPKDIQLIIF